MEAAGRIIKKLFRKFWTAGYRSIACSVLFLSIVIPTWAQSFGGASGIFTDYNGYWASSIGATNPLLPDNTHHLLAFTWNGVTYSTGIDDAKLDAHSLLYSAQVYQAFPVRNIGWTNGTYIGLGQMYDEIDNAISVPAPFSVPPNLSSFLTRGIQGLDFGSGVANIAAGNIIFDFTGIIDQTQIGDGIPDILVTQMADPSSTLDEIYMTDANGIRVGNSLRINHLNIPSLGKWSADFYRLDGLGAAFIKGTRDLRLWVADLSAFGITQHNYHLVRSMRYRLNGSSDPAFAAFKVGVFDIIAANDDQAEAMHNMPVEINVLTNDLPREILNPASLRVIHPPVNGTTAVDSQSGLVSYTPNEGFAGLDTFIYEICGSNAIQCDEATVFVDVAAGPLFYDFLDFDVNLKDNTGVILTWKRKLDHSESAAFVERSTDGKTWITLNQNKPVLSFWGIEYEYTDRFPILGETSYYRIRIETGYGTSIYSEVKRVNGQEKRHEAMRISPNPTYRTSKITWHGTPPLAWVLSTSGLDVTHLVKFQPIAFNSIEMDLSALPPGVYIIRTPSESRTITKK